MVLPTVLVGGALASGFRVPATLFILPPLGAMLLAPRAAVLRIQVSVSAFVLVVWLCMSYLWTIEQFETLFALREEIPPLIGLVIVIGLLPVDETIRWFVRGMKLLVLVSVIALIVDADSRTSVVDSEIVAGWASWFESKNQMGRGAALALLTFLTLDKTPVSRWVAIAATSVLIVGSSSAAALAASIILVGLILWVQQYRAVGQDWSANFVLASIVGGICAIVGVYLSAELVVSALGRDLSFTGRTDIWGASLDWFAREPWLGYGYKALFNPASDESRLIWREIGFEAANAHNGPLDLALGIGIPGLAAFYVLYVSTVVASLRLLRTHVIATWVFVFLVLQLLIGVVEPVYLGDWLPPLVFARTMLLKVHQEEHLRQAERATWLDSLGQSIDLDAGWDTKPVP